MIGGKRRELERLRRRVDQLETAEVVLTSPVGDLVRIMVADLEHLERWRGLDHPAILGHYLDLRLMVRLPPAP